MSWGVMVERHYVLGGYLGILWNSPIVLYAYNAKGRCFFHSSCFPRSYGTVVGESD